MIKPMFAAILLMVSMAHGEDMYDAAGEMVEPPPKYKIVHGNDGFWYRERATEPSCIPSFSVSFRESPILHIATAVGLVFFIGLMIKVFKDGEC